MVAPSVIDKINALPEDVQEQLFLYVDFLFTIYRSEAEELANDSFLDKFELTEAGRNFLEKRAQLALKHPERFKSWQEVRNKMAGKYNWPEN